MARPEVTALLSMGMFIITIVRYLKSTGTKIETRLEFREVQGVAWSNYAPRVSRTELVLSIRNTGSYPASLSQVTLEIASARTKRRKMSLDMPRIVNKNIKLPMEIEPGHTLSLTILPDKFEAAVSSAVAQSTLNPDDFNDGRILMRSCIRDNEGGKRRSAWLSMRAHQPGRASDGVG